MKRFIIIRKDDVVEVAIMFHKDGSGYGFINLTKGHVCKCRFATEEAARRDIMNDPRVLNFYELT